MEALLSVWGYLPEASVTYLGDPMVWVMLLAGTALGYFVGVMPGLGPTMGMALSLSIIYTLPVTQGMALRIGIFVSAVGSGGTVTGVGTYLKEQNPNVKVVAVEPASSPVLSQGKSGAHKIQGIGAGFVPDVLNTKIYDEVIPVENDDAFATGKKVGHSEGVLVGISSGAAVWAGIQLAKRPENKGKTIVVLLPDTGDRYLSTPLFAD